jgi:DNA-binding beta-propeller fold protein YncE
VSENASSDPQSFQCPTCGASLPVPDGPSVLCEYCGSNVLVPREYRPVKHPKRAATPKPQEATPTLFEAFGGKTWSSQRMVGSAAVAIIVFIAISIFALNANSFGKPSTNNAVDQEINATATWIVGKFMNAFATQAPVAEPATPEPPIKVLLKFGGEGSGAGKFDDPRYIALDPDINIFIADYADGRVQKFDPNGKFLQLINLEPDSNQRTTIRDMAANYSGSLFILRGGDILVYNTANGKLIDTIPGKFPELSYDLLAIDPANNLYAISEGAQFTDLIKFDPQGKQLWKKSNFLVGVIQKNSSAHIDQIAVNGLGNILVLNGLDNEIYKFDTQGDFVDRFGSKGNGPQQLNNPNTMTVDGSGKLFLVDSGNWYTIKVFDAGGAFAGAFAWPDDITAPRDIVFDLQGNLYTVTNQAIAARMTMDLVQLNK